MIFYLTYEIDFQRVISAVINDSRNTIPATTNQPGMVIYAYAQSQISLVGPGVLVYRIEVAETGVLAGYCLISVQNGVPSVLSIQPRPAFQTFMPQISQIIANFIQNSVYLQDLIY